MPPSSASRLVGSVLRSRRRSVSQDLDRRRDHPRRTGSRVIINEVRPCSRAVRWQVFCLPLPVFFEWLDQCRPQGSAISPCDLLWSSTMISATWSFGMSAYVLSSVFAAL